jgi:hypothetical protein
LGSTSSGNLPRGNKQKTKSKIFMKKNTIHPPELRDVPNATGHDTYMKRAAEHVARNADPEEKTVPRDAEPGTRDARAPQEGGRVSAAVLVLIALFCIVAALGLRAASTFLLTNNLPVGVYGILYSNTAAGGYVFATPATFIPTGTVASLSSTFPATGEGIYGTNGYSYLQLTPPVAVLGTAGTNISCIVTNPTVNVGVPVGWYLDTNAP